MHTFFKTVDHALDRYAHLEPRDNRDFIYWEETGTAKEAWRDATRFGFDGKEVALHLTALTDWLLKARSHLNALLPRFVDKESGLPITYVTHEILYYEIITTTIPEIGEKVAQTHSRGFPCVRIKAVRPHRLPLFLEATTHLRPDYHGRGFRPRTSGTTAEVLEVLLIMAFGKSPFRHTSQGLELAFAPVLFEWLFSGAATC